MFTAASVASGRHSRPRAGARDGTSLLAMIIASVWAVLFILASLLLGINLYTVAPSVAPRGERIHLV